MSSCSFLHHEQCVTIEYFPVSRALESLNNRQKILPRMMSATFKGKPYTTNTDVPKYKKAQEEIIKTFCYEPTFTGTAKTGT